MPAEDLYKISIQLNITAWIFESRNIKFHLLRDRALHTLYSLDFGRWGRIINSIEPKKIVKSKELEKFEELKLDIKETSGT